MPHATHFLERLDRVPRSLTDFALDLYRDEERVRWILHYAHLPPEHERVALALEDGGEGPYIVVTRQGAFVTALGRGMKPTNLPVLNRSQVDTFSARVADARRRHELAKEVVAPGKRPMDMIGLLTTRPSALSRTELTAIAAWVPLMNVHFLADAFAAAPKLEELRDAYASGNKRVRKTLLLPEALTNLWNASHGIAVRLVLATMGELVWVESLASIWTAEYGPTWLTTDERILSVCLRGMWAMARMGKPFLAVYKRILLESDLPTVRYDAILAVTAIGLRHAHLRDDARRLLEMKPAGGGERSAFEADRVRLALRALTDPDAATAAALVHAKAIVPIYAPVLPVGSPHRFERAEDVPDELALMVAANQSFDSTLAIAIDLLPWVARLTDPEELYLPDDLLRAHVLMDRPEQLAKIYERQLAGLAPKPVTRDAPKVGRNEACACGSGKKSKKCCAA